MKKTLLTLLFILWLTPLYAFSAENTLENSTGGNTIRWIVTSSEASWVVKVSLKSWETRLHAIFSNLSAPQWDDFYEGWLVRKSPFSIISTGRITKIDGEYNNYFSTSQDFSDYTHYVLTIEANDGNNTAWEHILEGKIVIVDDIEFIEKPEALDSEGNVIELNESQKQLITQVEARLVNVSVLQRMALLERVIDYQNRLGNLNIDEVKKAKFAEILEVLIFVLTK